jgi:hypothetical protein
MKKIQIEKFSLTKCRAVLHKDGSHNSDEEVLQIRDFLYMLAELDYEVHLKQALREQEFASEKNAAEQEEFREAA